MTDAVGAPPSRTRLAVLGSPIAHSKSPVLHAAAYAVLGLDWSFEAIEVREADVASFLGTVDDSWRGLAVTMPLKREIMAHLDEIDPLAQRVGATNTVRFDGGRSLGFNTDVYGVTRALGELGVTAPRRVALIGAGATASSVVVAVAELGARELQVVARSPERAAGTLALAESEGLHASIRGFDEAIDPHPDVVITTLPGGTVLGGHHLDTLVPAAVRASAPLFDVTYGHDQSELVSAWRSVGGVASNGLAMLLHQAVQQVRVFVGGSPTDPLDDEATMTAAMKAAL